MSSEAYDGKLLSFYMARYRYIRDSKVALSLQVSDTTYADGRMDEFEQYDDKTTALNAGKSSAR